MLRNDPCPYSPIHDDEIAANTIGFARCFANGFGFVDAASHMTIYGAPPSHLLSSDWYKDRLKIKQQRDEALRVGRLFRMVWIDLGLDIKAHMAVA